MNLRHGRYSPRGIGQASRLDRPLSQQKKGSRGKWETIDDAIKRENEATQDWTKNTPEGRVESAIAGLRQRLFDAQAGINRVDPARTRKKIAQVRLLIEQYRNNPKRKMEFFIELNNLESIQ